MRSTLFSALGFALCAAAFTAQAGPPLICHPYDIGNAQSLPWGHVYERGWDNKDPGYDVDRLAGDTLKILNSTTPVLVRMETLRRAVIYGERNHHVMATLLNALKDRTAKADAQAYFDYGFAVETMKQMLWKYKDDLTAGTDGYSFVEKALALNPGSAEMQFAAAIIAFYPRRADYQEHVDKARSGVSNGLLAENLRTHLE